MLDVPDLRGTNDSARAALSIHVARPQHLVSADYLEEAPLQLPALEPAREP